MTSSVWEHSRSLIGSKIGHSPVHETGVLQMLAPRLRGSVLPLPAPFLTWRCACLYYLRWRLRIQYTFVFHRGNMDSDTKRADFLSTDHNNGKKVWAMTLFNVMPDAFKEVVDSWIPFHIPDPIRYMGGQYELTKSGVPHFQGMIKLKKKMRLSTVRKLLPSELASAHLEPACDGDKLYSYCHKPENRMSGVNHFNYGQFFCMNNKRSIGRLAKLRKMDIMSVLKCVDKGEGMRKIKQILVDSDNVTRTQIELFNALPQCHTILKMCKEVADMERGETAKLDRKKEAMSITLRPWQKRLYNELMQPASDRRITVYVDTEGNHGKSFFKLFMMQLHPDEVFSFTCGKSTDIVHQIAKRAPTPRIFLMDLCRSDETGEQQRDSTNYDVIEQIKNRVLLSMEHEGGEVFIPSVPHVVIFTNKELNWNRCSGDRWTIHEFQQDDTIICKTAKSIAHDGSVAEWNESTEPPFYQSIPPEFPNLEEEQLLTSEDFDVGLEEVIVVE